MVSITYALLVGALLATSINATALGRRCPTADGDCGNLGDNNIPPPGNIDTVTSLLPAPVCPTAATVTVIAPAPVCPPAAIITVTAPAAIVTVTAPAAIVTVPAPVPACPPAVTVTVTVAPAPPVAPAPVPTPEPAPPTPPNNPGQPVGKLEFNGLKWPDHSTTLPASIAIMTVPAR